MKYVLCLLLPIILILSISFQVESTSGLTNAEKLSLLDYARNCMAAAVSGSPSPPAPEFATRQQRPCFVTFFIGRRVFACFGGFTPRRATLADEIRENVRLALKNDLRARSIRNEMTSQAGVQITFPHGQPERVEGYQSIDPAVDGMFVEGSGAGVAFVPGEARTSAWAFREALRRLGERDGSTVSVYRFKAESISTREKPGK